MARPVLEYRSACWDPCRGQINALDRVQKKAAQFTKHTKDSDWETLAQRRTIARLCALFKAYSGERAWKAIRDRLRRPYYLSRVDHVHLSPASPLPLATESAINITSARDTSHYNPEYSVMNSSPFK
jgi:hypothetical protein